MPAVEFRGVSVHFGQTCALSPLDLTVSRGETLAILGPSGSGKSTALKALAGFVRPSSGRVLLDGEDVTDLPPHRRGLGVVVQSYALFPHLRVADNVAFGLKSRKAPKAEVASRVAEVLDMVGMGAYAKRYPRELSGGQQQRVAIARALAIRPDVLLLDEPLSALDAALREDMVAELLRLRAELPGTTLVYVTHDQGEALALADRIAVMRDSRLVEVGPCERLYHRPSEEFTASFLGASNLIPVEVIGADGPARVTVRLGDHELSAEPTSALADGTKVALGVRPHRVGVRAASGGGTVPARLTGVQWRGSGFRLDLELAVDGMPPSAVRAEVPSVDGLPGVGEPVGVSIPDGCPLVAVRA
ncbi:ABC transporter ATP-binding protein [Amycolatopsis sp. CA-230715]|uniref:ABC transporter ATP-binding protein n=1 Tax=Amycolatopsis sp. CA-230715 TaxID=2745196 RepID=UPI001C338377|nr:ABC transporter ATP-binding protein [Amycolatopsis sp. CA-230715]QWF77461.1 Putative 2-aminoethylphosphonate import ATP-binding protein PhnT [Amycolatopsis sp. CA-230715]